MLDPAYAASAIVALAPIHAKDALPARVSHRLAHSVEKGQLGVDKSFSRQYNPINLASQHVLGIRETGGTMAEEEISCAEPVKQPGLGGGERAQVVQKEEARMDTAHAYVKGSFKQIALSDYSGQWVVLCFYPGDFTFV